MVTVGASLGQATLFLHLFVFPVVGPPSYGLALGLCNCKMIPAPTE